MKTVSLILIAVVLGLLVGTVCADEELESILIGPMWGPDLESETVTVQPIPEPATISLLMIGGLALVRRRRRA